mgnify:CR=1 FL=1
MKTLKYLAAAALTLLAVGCNKEQVAETPDGQMVDVTFTAALPGEMATKALGDGQTAKNLYVSVYENDADKTHLRDLDKTATFTDLKTQVKFSLVKGKTYNFVFWAQAEGAPYDVTDLKSIKVKNYTTGANDEKRDAFYATRKELKVNGALTETIKLYRPFAQVNFATADYADAMKAGFNPAVSSFTASEAAKTFDTFAEEGKDKVEVSLTETEIPADVLKTLDGKTYTRLAMNYLIPVGKQGESHNIDVAATFKANNGEAVTVSAPNAPVQNNYRTNILGNLLTSQVIFNVEIVPIFNEPDYDIDLVKDVESLKALVATGGSAKLVDDIEIDYPLVLSGNTDVVIDLNGHSIVNKTQVNGNYTVVFNVTGNSHLTINGEGEVKALEETSDVDGYRMAIWAYDDAVVDINGGYFYNKQLNPGTSNLIYVMDRAVVNVAGGKFETAMLDAQGTSLLLNIYDHDRATAKINVTGGQFVAFDPADCISEGPHTNFVADGYKSTQIGDSYFVTKAGVTPVANQEGFEDVISKGSVGTPIEIQVSPNSTIVLKDGLANEGVKARNITIVGNGSQTVDVISGSKNAEGGMLSYQRGSSFTFKNLKIKAGEGNFDGVVCDELVFENCTITGKLTLFGKASFKDCVFENTMANQYSIWTWGGTDVTFDKCAFNTNGKAILLYGGADGKNPTNLVVKNCILNDRNNGSAGKAAIEIGNDYNATYSLTITNCTVNGFAEGKNTGSKLWANKNSMDAAHLSVTIDGTKVQ